MSQIALEKKYAEVDCQDLYLIYNRSNVPSYIFTVISVLNHYLKGCMVYFLIYCHYWYVHIYLPKLT